MNQIDQQVSSNEINLFNERRTFQLMWHTNFIMHYNDIHIDDSFLLEWVNLSHEHQEVSLQISIESM